MDDKFWFLFFLSNEAIKLKRKKCSRNGIRIRIQFEIRCLNCRKVNGQKQVSFVEVEYKTGEQKSDQNSSFILFFSNATIIALTVFCRPSIRSPIYCIVWCMFYGFYSSISFNQFIGLFHFYSFPMSFSSLPSYILGFFSGGSRSFRECRVAMFWLNYGYFWANTSRLS